MHPSHPTRTPHIIPPKTPCRINTRACEPRRTFRAEPGEHHRVRGADASARQHDESQLQPLHTSTTGEPAAQAATTSSSNFSRQRAMSHGGHQDLMDRNTRTTRSLSTSFWVIDHNGKIRDLGDHGHVHSHGVALLDASLLERVGDLAHLAQHLPARQTVRGCVEVGSARVRGGRCEPVSRDRATACRC